MIPLADAVDTEEAMRRYVAALDPGPSAPAVVAVIGAGSGALPAAVHARWPDAAVVILEPVPEPARAAPPQMQELVESGRLITSMAVGSDAASQLWRAFDRWGTSPHVVVNPVLVRTIPTAMKSAARILGRAVAAARMNADARASQAGPYLLNTLRNLGHIERGSDVACLRNRFLDMPAVVVGAGPSLDTQIESLRLIQSRALLIATDTAWRPLAIAGIEPHLVVALDPTAANGQHLRDVPAAALPWIVAEGSVDPDALATLTGRVAIFRVARHHPWPWLQASGLDRGLLRAWGSVLTSSLDLALMCGCHPVALVGADLAFTGGRPYCRGTTHEEMWATHLGGGATLHQVWADVLAARAQTELPDVTGTTVATAPHLVEFRDWIVARAGDVGPGRIVNASGAGILHGPNVGQAALQDLLAASPEHAAAMRETLDGVLKPMPDEGIAARRRSAMWRAAESDRSAWKAFAGPAVTDEAIEAALSAGLTDAASAGSAAEQARRRVRQRWWPADRIVAARALLTGEPFPPEVCRPASRSRGHDDLADRALRIVDELLARSWLVAPVEEQGFMMADAPLSCRFAWAPSVKGLVGELEEVILDVECEQFGAGGVADAAYWRGAVASTPGDEAPGGGAHPPSETAARAALELERVAVRLWTAAPALSRRGRRILGAARRGLAHPSMLRSVATVVDIDGTRTTVPLVPDAFARAVTGNVVLDGVDDPEPRQAFLRNVALAVEPRVLTKAGCPTGWSVCGDVMARAVFTPATGASASLLVDEAGRIETGASWPAHISGEIPWGDEGGAIAWNAVDWSWSWRPRPGAATVSGRFPVRPVHIAVGERGAVVLTDPDGGVWRWTPGSPAIRLCELPLSGIPRFEGNRLLVGPTVRDRQGRVVRRQLRHEWEVDVASGRWTSIAAGKAGQGAKAASSLDLTATTHPFGDAVRLQSRSGASWWLACHAPLGVAWTGRSLLVTTGMGDLLLFPRLLDRLLSSEPGPDLAR